MKRFDNILVWLMLAAVTGFGLPYRGFSQNAIDSTTGNQKIKNFTTISEWESYFNQKTASGGKALPEEYTKAAMKSFSEKNYVLSIIWYEEAKSGNYSDAGMYSTIAAIYRILGDQAEEMKAMNYYLKKYPEGSETGSFKERFFNIFTAGKNYDRINESWAALADSSRKKESLLNTYFISQKEKNDKESCDSLAKKILLVNPKHVSALEWLGEKYYWLGENGYKQSMKKYEQNKTSLQHLMLTQEFENVSTDFKKALSYFDVLWEISHNARYASFMANIHARFKNDQKTEYYKRFIK